MELGETKKIKYRKIPWRHLQLSAQCHICPRDNKTSPPNQENPKSQN